MEHPEEPPAKRSLIVRATARALGWVGWAAFAVVFAALVFAYVYPDDPSRRDLVFDVIGAAVFLIRTATFHAGLGFLALGLLATLLRRGRLAALSGVVAVVILLPIAWSLIPRGGREPTGPGEARTALRVMTINLLFTNLDFDAAAASVLDADPDVLIVQEFTTTWARELTSRLASRYEHVHAPNGPDGRFLQAVFSKRPFVRADTLRLGDGWWPKEHPAVLVRHEGREVLIAGVHMPTPPSFELVTQNRRYHATLADLARQRGGAFIIGGDFNATPYGTGAAALRRAGLRDAFATVGIGPGWTWPADRGLGWTAGFRIDQLWASGDLLPIRAWRGLPTGSDHRPVVAEYVWK